MLTAVNYLQLLFPDFSLILLGYLVCRFTALDRSVWTAVERLVYYLLFPVLLFHSIVRQPLDLTAASELVLAGWALCLGGIGMAYVLPYLPWIGPRVNRREHAAGAQVAFRFNTFIALALADRMLGAQGTVLIAVLVGVCVPVLNIGAVWPRGPSRRSCRSYAWRLGSRTCSRPTPCGMASRRTWCDRGRTSESCKSSWGTPG